MSSSFSFTPSPPPPAPPTGPPYGSEPRRTFADAIREVSPWWLRGPIAGGTLRAIATQLDVLTDRVVAGVKLRFPGLYSGETLPMLGRERRIRRGRFEADATYATRLLRWLDDHRYRGGPYAMLAQLHAYYAPGNFPIELRYASGRRYQLASDGTITRGTIVWSPGGPAEQWARWWLIYDWSDAIDGDGVWSDPGTWDDGGVWDCDLTPAEVRDIRLIPREWNPAHAIGRVTLVSPGLTITISVQFS